MKGPESNRFAADQFAAQLKPLIHELQIAGITSQRAIARELERRGIRAPRGGDWSAAQVGSSSDWTRWCKQVSWIVSAAILTLIVAFAALLLAER
jgi:hypothetical protein